LNPRPLVSALINNYNYGRFLKDAIESALNQTYPNIEVIVVDDGSTDDSRAIIRSYGSRVIPVLKSNGGQASAVNAGVGVSEGEIVCLLDADDVWLPNKVEEIVGAAAEEPESVLLYHRLQPVSGELRPCGKMVPKGLFRGSIADLVRNSGGWWACPATSALCFRRTVLKTIGPIPETDLRYAADGYLTYIVPLFGPVVGLAKCLTLYRFHGSNQSQLTASERLAQYEDVINSVNRRLTQLELHGLRLENHMGYQLSRYRASLPGHLRRDQLAWKALLLEGEPRMFHRVKNSVKILVKG
jgi:glycosyltransferase involved in cell wall biosynthesis